MRLNEGMSAVPPPPPDAGSAPSRPTWLPWAIVAGAAAVILLAGLVAFAVAQSGGTPTSVEEVSERAVEAAEDLDVGAGIDLLCDPPAEQSRRLLDTLIAGAQEETGSDHPEVAIDIVEVSGEASGEFIARITSPEEAFEGEEQQVTIAVGERDGRSCIEEFRFSVPGEDPVVIDKDGIGEP